MNEAKVWELDYINFLLATPRVVSATEAERAQPEGPRRAAHDAFTRLLHRLEPDTTPLWLEAESLIDRTCALLVIDDSTLDKPYSYDIALVHRQWSGKHRRVVSGINLVSLVWGLLHSAFPHRKQPVSSRGPDSWEHVGLARPLVCESPAQPLEQP